jgi:glutaredoxin
MDSCPYCDTLKEKLNEMEIPFEERSIHNEEYVEEFDKICKATNNDSVPVVRVGNQLFLPEISFVSIDEAANLTQKFYNQLNS